MVLRILFLLILVTSGNYLAKGQDAAPSGRILEITSGRMPRPDVIALHTDRPSGFWASGFPRTKDWKVPETGDPVHVLNFSGRLIGDRAELVISSFSGKRFDDIRENIATVMISEGETVVASDMKKFGFEPVTIRMLRTTTAIADVPMVSNPAPLLRTTVSTTVATLPTFKVSFLNESKKDVMAFAWHTEAGGRMLLSALRQGSFGKPLIESGGTYEINVRANQQDGPSNTVNFVIGAVIYKDGSIDGDPKAASTFLFFTEGRKNALNRIVPIFQKVLETDSSRIDIQGLIKLVDGLTDGSPLVKGRPSTAAGIAFSGVVSDALKSLRQLDSESAGRTDAEVREMVSEIATLYREWQSRMLN